MGSGSETTIVDRLDTIVTLLAQLAEAQPRLSYNARQAAAITGLSETRVYQLVAEGRLEKVPNLGTSVLVPHASLVALIAETE